MRFEGPLDNVIYSSCKACVIVTSDLKTDLQRRKQTCKNPFNSFHILGALNEAKCVAMHDNQTCPDNLDFCFPTAVFIDSMFAQLQSFTKGFGEQVEN